MSKTYLFDADGVPGSLSNFGVFFSLDGGGTVSVTQDGYSIGQGINLQQGLWKVTINGVVTSTTNYAYGVGAFFDAGSSITVGETGQITGYDGISSNGATTVTNHGVVIGQRAGVEINGYGSALTVTNTGIIQIIYTDNVSEFAVDLFGWGKHTVNNSGHIYGGIGFNTDASDPNPYLSDDTVNNTGYIDGNIVMGDGKDTLTNKGYINDTVYMDWGDDTLTNSGMIGADVNGYVGKDKITNSGQILGTLFAGADDDAVSNTGTIGVDADMGTGNDKFDNKGDISGIVYLGEGNDTFTNSGHIGQDIQGFDGDDKITNSGHVDGFLNAGIGNDTVSNTGTISGEVALWDGNDKFDNKGAVGDSVWAGLGDDSVTNSGTIKGDFNGEADNDTFTNTGTVSGKIYMGAGNDTFNGGKQSETLVDGAGGDKYYLGAGDDRFIAVDVANGSGDAGIDTVDGGTNSTDVIHGYNGDVYDASAAANAVVINLDTVLHTGLGADTVSQAAGMATGTDIGTDMIKGFEHVEGGSGGDHIWGSTANELLGGNDGDDFLFGMAGNDKLYGDKGADTLVGGIGAEYIYAGEADGDADRFVYTSVKDSTVGASGRDILFDFEDGTDHIVFLGLGNIHVAAPNPVNAVFDNTPGSLRVISTLYGWTLQIDTTGDKKADMAIDVSDHSHTIVWDASDFMLS